MKAREAFEDIKASKPVQQAKQVGEKVMASKPVQTAQRAAGIGFKALKLKGQYDQARHFAGTASSDLQKATRTPPPPAGVKGVHASQKFRLKKEAEVEWGKELKGAGSAALTSAGAVLGGMAVRAGMKGVGSMYERSRRNRLWQQLAQRDKMLTKSPRARDYFDLALTYAPSLGKHPLAIGDFLKKQLQYPVSSHEFLKSLADFEATVSKTEEGRAPARVGLAFETAAQSLPVAYYQGRAAESGKRSAT